MGNTECAVYADREPGMEIILRRPDGSWFPGTCVHETPEEFDILAALIRKGKCSLEVDNG